MFLYILFIGHFLADFTFQSEKMVARKLQSFKYLIFHALTYAAVFLVTIFPLIKFHRAIIPYIIIITSHFFIDWIRICICKKSDRKAIKFFSFIIDQILHILILATIYYAFDLGEKITKLYGLLQQWPYFYEMVVYCLILVILLDPASVFVKKLLAYIDHAQEDDSQAGRIIGKLERIVISVFILYNQFGAIGFALTAKSIARYKQLEDKNFAEKYLVGTLASVLIAIIITVILKQQL